MPRLGYRMRLCGCVFQNATLLYWSKRHYSSRRTHNTIVAPVDSLSTCVVADKVGRGISRLAPQGWSAVRNTNALNRCVRRTHDSLVRIFCHAHWQSTRQTALYISSTSCACAIISISHNSLALYFRGNSDKFLLRREYIYIYIYILQGLHAVKSGREVGSVTTPVLLC
jgi:hypothetical protein